MAYQCIPLSTKDYKAALKRVLAHPAKSKKYTQLNDRYELTAKALTQLETLGPSDHLPAIVDPLKASLKTCQEGMARLLDSEYRAMQKEAKRNAARKSRPAKNELT
jgi:hypothetical protein